MFLTLSLGILYFTAPVALANTRGVGNLEVTLRAPGTQLISTFQNPIVGPTNDLWCQAQIDKQVTELTWARFIRIRDKKQLDAVLDEGHLKARLVFGEIPVTEAGKYRCEMRISNGDLIYGNMFVNVRPVIHTNETKVLKISEHDPTLVEAQPVAFPSGTTAELNCPVIGYPIPNIVWYKDGLPLEEEGRVTFLKTSAFIEDVQASDVGKYRCVATNQFQINNEGAEQEFEIKMDQELQLSGNYGWVLPLIIILVILLLVFICIYAWQACSKYKSSNYNVARREQNLRRAEEQRGLTKDVN